MAQLMVCIGKSTVSTQEAQVSGTGKKAIKNHSILESALPYTNWNYAQMTLQEQLPRLLYDCQFMPRQSQHEFNLVRLSANHAYFVGFICAFIKIIIKFR